MPGHLTNSEIAEELQAVAKEFYDYCTALSDKQFFTQPPNKWSPAQQVKHLITSTSTARYAFTLPAFLVRMVGGTPNRPSRTYDELVERYQQKLRMGGKASGRYIPKPIRPSFGKEKLLGLFNEAMTGFSTAVQNYQQDPGPDEYLAPHPLLGKITLRELCYFTIYHCRHHLLAIQKQVDDLPNK